MPKPDSEIIALPHGDSDTVRRYVDTLLAIEAECFEEEIRNSYTSFYNSLYKNHVLVARKNRKIAGFLIYRVEQDNLHVMEIAVAKEYQRCHIGTALMQHVEAQALTSQRNLTLQARPLNEPFYRHLGFKPLTLEADYYQYDHVENTRYAISVPGIFMKKMVQPVPNVSLKANAHSLWYTPAETSAYDAYRNQLMALVEKVNVSSSAWYGGMFAFGRSRRKEAAFATILLELNALGNKNTSSRSLNPHKVLQTIIYNAMMIRGFGIVSSETTSGQALVNFLNRAEFSRLKNLVSSDNKKALTYYDLQVFAELNERPRSSDTPTPYSPYHYF